MLRRWKSGRLPRPSWSFPRLLSVVALLAALAAGWPSALHARQPSPQTEAFTVRPEEELLLLAVRLQRDVLTDSMAAYPLEGGVVVPLGEMMRLLDFAIDVDVVSRSASGFFIAEERRFELDVDRATAIVEGKVTTFDPQRVEVHQDDIYVDAALLGRWFPVDVAVNLYGALITLTPREPLPMQIRAEREKKISAGLRALGRGPSYPLESHPFAPLQEPFVDTSLLFDRRARDGEETLQQFRHATYFAGDLLWGTATAFVSGSDDEPAQESRFSWGRRDPTASLLGPLRSTEAIIGDHSYPGLDLVARSASGSGFLLTNYPLTRLTQFDSHTFRGELPPGWDVELYRNGALVDYQRSRQDGLYEFNEVPVLFGMNVFRLVFYGPQGQRREQTEIFNVGETLTPPGELRYRLSHADPRSLSTRSLAQFEYGLSPSASAELSFAEVGVDDGERRYAKATLHAVRRSWLGQLDAIRDDGGGTLFGAGISTQLRGLSLSARWAALDGFVSEDLPARFGPVESHAVFRLVGTAGSASSFQLPVTLEVERDELVEGGAAYTVRNTVSTFHRGFAATNRLNGTWFAGAGRPAFAQGSFILSRWMRGDSLRGEVGYDLEPDFDASFLQAIWDTRRFAGYLLSAGVQHNLRSDDTTWLLGGSKRTGAWGMAAALEFSDEGLSARLLLNAGIGRDPFGGGWFTSARTLTASGAASVLVFLDEDGDGEKDPGEDPIEGAAFFINRASSPLETDERGEALFSGLPSYGFTDIALSTSSLEDPYLVPTNKGFRFVPRPGSVMRFLFPVRMTGEVAGTVYLVRDGQLREAPGVEVQLVAADGTVAHEARTEYDGFYNIAMVMPGSYTLRVAPAQQERIGMKAEPRAVLIGPEGSVRDGVDLRLQPAQ